MPRLTTLVATAFLAAAACLPAHAQRSDPETKPASPQQAGPNQNIQLTGVDLAILIKSAIVALHQANMTGNYSVLRDLGSPIFREKFDQAQLTAIFGSLRQRGISLAPALMLNPSLTKQPDLTDLGALTLVGTFPTQPLQIKFQIVYQRVGQAWRIDGMAVDAVPVEGVPQASAAPPPAAGQQAEAPKTAQASPANGDKPKEKKKAKKDQ